MNKKKAAMGIAETADRILESRRILSNPYLEALAKGGMTRAGFLLTQEQFFYAVTFYPRPMAGLLARLPDPKARLDILHNLVEEHGEFKEKAFHHTTFRTFLSRMGSRLDKLDHLDLWPEVRAFNSSLTTACILDEVEVGIGCMGIIEYAFADISAAIGKAVVDNGWIPKSQLVHYSLHASLDKQHARDFFALAEQGWRARGRRYYVRQGLELGAYIFDRLYADLHKSITRR